MLIRCAAAWSYLFDTMSVGALPACLWEEAGVVLVRRDPVGTLMRELTCPS